MTLKVAYDITGVLHEIEWSWVLAEDWVPEIETIDGKPPGDLTDEQIEAIQIACMDDYPLGQYLSERDMDVDYYSAGD